MRPVLLSLLVGVLLTAAGLFVIDRISAACGDHRSVPLCLPEQR